MKDLETFLKTDPFKTISKEKAYLEVAYHPNEGNLFAEEIKSTFLLYKAFIVCNYKDKYKTLYEYIEYFYNKRQSIAIEKDILKEFDVGFLGDEKINKKYYSIFFDDYQDLENAGAYFAYLRPTQITEVRSVKDLINGDMLFVAKKRVFLDDVDECSGIIEGLVGTLYTYEINEVF
ncbi:hypothetical protein PGDDIFCJ_00106 [Thermus phage YS40_Isch]|nr:hypothetical protein PGDDIFCJ_00106 [Thermus phage YS40_Isch]